MYIFHNSIQFQLKCPVAEPCYQTAILSRIINKFSAVDQYIRRKLQTLSNWNENTLMLVHTYVHPSHLNCMSITFSLNFLHLCLKVFHGTRMQRIRLQAHLLRHYINFTGSLQYLTTCLF